MSTQMMTPPPELNFVGTPDFAEIGQEFLGHFINAGGLQPHHRVLDVGCGIGRMAIPLTQYLSSQGSYKGFDIVDVGINWCNAQISGRYPNFRFQMADVFNRGYNPTGRYEAQDYTFPYPKNQFDFVFLTSVFTHMVPNDFQNYLAEIARVLKPGGRCFSTYFLITANSARLISEGKAQIHLQPQEKYWVRNPDVPEDAIGLPADYVFHQYARFGLEIDLPVHYGRWCGRPEGLSWQDVLLATKPKTGSTLRVAAKNTVRYLHHLASRSLGPLLKRPKRNGVWNAVVPDGVAQVRDYARNNPQLFQRPAAANG